MTSGPGPRFDHRPVKVVSAHNSTLSPPMLRPHLQRSPPSNHRIARPAARALKPRHLIEKYPHLFVAPTLGAFNVKPRRITLNLFHPQPIIRLQLEKRTKVWNWVGVARKQTNLRSPK